MFKKQTGITLVALVVTIIVLLILAGVSISLVVGNNGVITQATNSVVKTRAAEAKQAVDLALGTAEAEYHVQHINDSSITREAVYATEFTKELQNQGYQVTDADTIVISDGYADAPYATVSLKKGNDTITIDMKVNNATGAVAFDTVKVGTEEVFNYDTTNDSEG